MFVQKSIIKQNNQFSSLVGGTIDYEEQVCGAEVSNRNNDLRVSVWTKAGGDLALQKKVGHRLKSALQLSKDKLLVYKVHKSGKVVYRMTK